MIREPARVQATTYETTPNNEENKGVTVSGQYYSTNCSCSQRRTEQTVLTKDSSMSTSTRTTTIPIVINTLPNPRIILIKVPTHNNNKSNRTEPSAPRTRLIRIPFLPGSEPTTASVKRALPTANSSVNYTTPAIASRIARQAANPLTGTIYPAEECSNSLYSQLNQVASDPTPALLNPITTTVTQTVQVSSTPQTLASMAGIQLTGADMQSHQDMSGAMPTATVEEIDVPVFIDEYLQNIDSTSSTSTSIESEEIGQKISTETDEFYLDFDINLFADDHMEQMEKMDLCNREIDSNYSDNINSDLTMDELQFSEGEESIDMGSICNGVNINNIVGDFDLANAIMTNEDPIFSNFSQGSVLGSSQTKYISELPQLADDNSLDNYYASSQNSLGFGLSHLNNATEDPCTAMAVHDVAPTVSVGVKRSALAAADSIPQKRSKLLININKSLGSQADAINTPDIIEQVLNFDQFNSASNISTQNMIYEDLRSAEETTSFTTLPDFSAPNTPNSSYSISTSHSHSHPVTCQTGFAGYLTAPVSPALSTASTSQFSVTTSTTNGSSKRKRGRPAKEHADGPDLNLMSTMTEDEAKAYRDRIKNNEASRVSRRKTKQREAEEMQEEEVLLATNEELSAKLERLLRYSKRCKDYLKHNHHKNSTFVKPEPEC